MRCFLPHLLVAELWRVCAPIGAIKPQLAPIRLSFALSIELQAKIRYLLACELCCVPACDPGTINEQQFDQKRVGFGLGSNSKLGACAVGA